MLRRFAYLILVLPLLGACSSMQISDFKGTTPELKLEEFFQGRSKAWGIFEDRFGNLRREFTVDIEGTWDGETLTLVEDFLYSDGETEQRIWKINKTGEKTYSGRANDTIGTAEGQAEGKAMTWSYDFMLKMDSRAFKVRFQDWFFLQSKDVLVNRAEVSKFGITLGRATIFFQRLDGTAEKTSRKTDEQDDAQSDRRGKEAA